MTLTRTELFTKLGIITYGPQIDSLTQRAYLDYEERIWRENLESAPHGHPWHTSFHGSSFPGDEKACGRLALYTMMDIPNPEPISPLLRATAEMGKAAEHQILVRWGFSNYLIAGIPPKDDSDPGAQAQFADPDTWLSGSVDAILGIPNHPFVLPVDIKSKSTKIIDQMRTGELSYDPKHYAQVQGYMYLCDRFYEDFIWADLGFKPPVGAIIYYVSRENPRYTKEFYVDRDDEFIDAGIKRLVEWKGHWLNGTLPERPKSWKWTEDPCKWCNFKKFVCKPDYKDKITKLEDSHGIEFAKTLREYDFEKVKKGVNDRWINN